MNVISSESVKPAAGRRTKDILWGAIMDLHAHDQVITREVLRKRFIEDDESLRRLKAGVFRLLRAQPPIRPVGLTIEEIGGPVTAKVGDQSLSMSHREAHILGLQLAGFAQCTHAQIAADEALADTLR
ncbi:hypothetical protein [Hydrogenophaga sp.]|uniref:hypothetical protein n=1 Tax=Hydrogenophaga sp. TaxID=1904254 RepID=UPI0025BE2FA5|nr:hypothetical protein [Hydrogenophaga sp.]MBT9462536.1 hypothetical protein [Hydrogenophaga sp.]